MITDKTYRDRSLMQMTPAELRQALQDTVKQIEAEPRRGITVEETGTRALDRAFDETVWP